MPTINQLVGQWRGWINRSKSFDGKELDELENHLLEEIDYLTEKDGLSEDEAFSKAVIEMGKRDNLDKEFTKVRGLPIQKIKHWFMIHSWIIGALIVMLVVTQIDFTKFRKPLPFIEKESIGSILWPKEFYAFPNIVLNGNKTYFSDLFNDNVYVFHHEDMFNNCDKKTSIDGGLAGSYFAELPNSILFSSFDIDNQNRFYFLSQNEKIPNIKDYNLIKVYLNSQLVKNIPIPEKGGTKVNYSEIKIIDSTVILVRNHFDNSKKSGNAIGNDLIYFDLNDAEMNLSIIKINGNIFSVDRSEKKLAILTNDGLIKIFAMQNKQLVELKTLKVLGFADYLSKSLSSIAISYSARNDQIVLKNYRLSNLSYYLLPIGYNQLEMVSLQKTKKIYSESKVFRDMGLCNIENIDKEVLGVLKINYLGEERFVLIKKDTPPDWLGVNLYLFK